MLGETVKLCEIMNQVRWQSGLKALKKGQLIEVTGRFSRFQGQRVHQWFENNTRIMTFSAATALHTEKNACNMGDWIF